MKKYMVPLFAATVVAQTAIAGSATMDDVRFFEHFQKDAARSAAIYIEGGGVYAKYDDPDFSATGVSIRGGIPLAENIEAGFSGGWGQVKPDKGDSESGLMDIGVVGKYHLNSQENNRITVGASITLPVGDEDIGQGDTDIGFFGAIRHPVNNKTVVMGTAGLDFVERGDDDRDTSFHLGGGAIYQMDQQLHLTGEFGMDTEGDIMALTAGADYLVQSNGRFRGAISLGLDDGSPDFSLQAGYLVRY